MRNLFSERFLDWIEWAIIVQLVVVALFVVSVFIAKLYMYLQNRQQAKRRMRLQQGFQGIVQGKEKLSLALIKLCSKDLEVTLSVIEDMDKNHDSPAWQESKIQIAEKALCPKARRYAYSRKWFKRYLATQCFHLQFRPEDEAVLQKLIIDPVMLVSLDASEVAVLNPSQTTMDTVIDYFSETRHIRQTSFAQILSSHQPHIDHLFIHRLHREENPYIKAFCYRMLIELPVDQALFEPAEKDADNDNLELSIAALKYLTHVNAEQVRNLLIQKLSSEKWQLREQAVNLLGKLKDKDAAAAIAEKLKDPEWWVRIKAAEALAEMGETGIALLKQQDASADKFAYEAAQFMLKTTES